MDRRGRLLGSLNQSRWETPALAASPRFLIQPQPLFAGPAPDGIAAPHTAARAATQRTRRLWFVRLTALALLVAGSAARAAFRHQRRPSAVGLAGARRSMAGRQEAWASIRCRWRGIAIRRTPIFSMPSIWAIPARCCASTARKPPIACCACPGSSACKSSRWCRTACMSSSRSARLMPSGSTRAGAS